MPTIETVQLGRAKNLVMSHFERFLYIPRVYLDAAWNFFPINVLAIDRDGTGDVHAAILFNLDRSSPEERRQKEAEVLRLLSGINTHFKYVCSVSDKATLVNYPRRSPSAPFRDNFADDGIGRVGFLEVVVPTEGDGAVIVEVKPERFRAHIGKVTDKFVQEHEADWEIRA